MSLTLRKWCQLSARLITPPRRPPPPPAFPFFPIRARRLAIYSSLSPPPLPSLRLCHRHSPINFKSPSRRVLLITRNFEIRSHGARLNSGGKKRTREREIVFISPSRTIAIQIPPGISPHRRFKNKEFNRPSFLSLPSSVRVRLVQNYRRREGRKLLEIIEDKVENGGKEEEEEE